MLKAMNSEHSFIVLIFILIGSILQSQTVYAKITLANGSYHNRTHIDAALRTANLNFVYEGCDPSPDPSKITLQTDGTCKDAKDYLEREGNNASISGTVGEIVAKYNEDSSTRCSNPRRVELSSNYSLSQMYNQFEKKSCHPTHLVIRDSEDAAHSRIVKDNQNKSLCNLRDVHITKDGFPTEELGILNLKANDDGFKIGDETAYRFDPNRGWCIKYKENPEKCGQWPTPVPIAYKDTTNGTHHLTGVINLTNDGKASIHGINKSYSSYQEMFTDLRNGGGSQVDDSKGKIEFHTWTKKNGVKRAIVRSYDGQGKHQRSINLFSRNIFGSEVAQQWCTGEHCFFSVDQPPLKQHQCKNPPAVDLDNGGSGNLCYSCVGITPGLCAIRGEDVDKVRENLGESDGFALTKYGEYQFSKDAETGLKKKFAHMISQPTNPGCHPGHASENRSTFEPEVDEASENSEIRTVNSLKNQKKNKKKKKESL